MNPEINPYLLSADAKKSDSPSKSPTRKDKQQTPNLKSIPIPIPSNPKSKEDSVSSSSSKSFYSKSFNSDSVSQSSSKLGLSSSVNSSNSKPSLIDLNISKSYNLPGLKNYNELNFDDGDVDKSSDHDSFSESSSVDEVFDLRRPPTSEILPLQVLSIESPLMNNQNTSLSAQSNVDRERKFKQSKLLLVSLLENFCMLYDQSPERNRKLFFLLCKQLSMMGV
jgi:hypothetical protein